MVLPAGYDLGLRAGRDAEVTFVVDQTRPAPAPVRSAVAAAVARHGAQVRAARFAAQEAGVPFDTALTRARALSDEQPQVRVAAATVGGRTDALPSGFNYTAPAALLLTVTFALVATGVGMLGGSVLRNAEQATSIGPRSASPSACSAAACGPWPSSPSPCASSATCSPMPGPWTPSSP